MLPSGEKAFCRFSVDPQVEKSTRGYRELIVRNCKFELLFSVLHLQKRVFLEGIVDVLFPAVLGRAPVVHDLQDH